MGPRGRSGQWQRAVPVWLMSVILIAVASGIGVWWVRQAFVWTPLQQFYLSAYTRSALASSLAHSDRTLSLLSWRTGAALGWPSTRRSFRSRRRRARRRSRCRAAQQARTGRSCGAISSSVTFASTSDLQVWIYRNQTLTDLARPSLITALVLILGLLVAIPKDVQWSRSRRHGRRLKGPELVTVGDSIGGRARTASGSFRWHASGPGSWVSSRCSEFRAIESSHPARHGRLWHRQVGADSTDPPAARGPRRYGHRVRPGPGIHAAVLHARTRRRDPQSHRHALAVLEPGDELRHEAEALAATSLFPDRANEESLLHRRPTAHLCAPTHVPPTAENWRSGCVMTKSSIVVRGTPYASIYHHGVLPPRALWRGVIVPGTANRSMFASRQPRKTGTRAAQSPPGLVRISGRVDPPDVWRRRPGLSALQGAAAPRGAD